MEKLDSTSDYVEFYLAKPRQGDLEAAFHGLTEAGRSMIPRLVDAFHQEPRNVRSRFVLNS